MLIFFIVLSILFAASAGKAVYLYHKQVGMTQALEFELEDSENVIERHREVFHDSILKSIRTISKLNEQHIVDLENLQKQLDRSNAIVEMLLDPRVQNDLTLHRKKARKLFVA